MEQFDELKAFLHWWMAVRVINTPPESQLIFQKETRGVTLFRQDPFQVELFIVEPNSEIVPHIHPNVDSYEVYVSGDIIFTRDGEAFKQTVYGDAIRVKPHSWHGGKFGERGGSFLSVQKWLNGVKPTFVGDDWKDKDNTASYKESNVKD